MKIFSKEIFSVIMSNNAKINLENYPKLSEIIFANSSHTNKCLHNYPAPCNRGYLYYYKSFHQMISLTVRQTPLPSFILHLSLSFSTSVVLSWRVPNLLVSNSEDALSESLLILTISNFFLIWLVLLHQIQHQGLHLKILAIFSSFVGFSIPYFLSIKLEDLIVISVERRLL